MIFAKINNTVIELEVADTLEKAKQGLSGRRSLGKNKGMLFTFPNLNPVIQTKQMNFPLELLFIDSNNVINDIVYAPKSDDLFEGEGYYVIEVNKDFSKENDVKINDKVMFLSSSNTNQQLKKLAKGGSLKREMLSIMDGEGGVQKKILSGSRIVSRIETKKLFELASKATNKKNTQALGLLMVRIINGQNNRKPEYVE